MTIENKLFELSTLTDYGTQYLLDRHELLKDCVSAREVTDMSLEDFMELQDMSDYDVMDYVSRENLISYVRDMILDGSIDADELVYSEDMIDYVRENCSIGEVFDDWDIKDYVKDNFCVEELVDWK